MGQTSISILNKTGYSMFWSSVWDQKILYSRNLKEDLLLNSFFDLSFNDSLSVNLLTFKKNDVINHKKYNFNVNYKNSVFYRFILNNNKVNYTSSKIWILKYQKWVVIYQFIFIPNLKKTIINDNDNDFLYKNSLSYILKFYKKINSSFYINYNKKFFINNIF